MNNNENTPKGRILTLDRRKFLLAGAIAGGSVALGGITAAFAMGGGGVTGNELSVPGVGGIVTWYEYGYTYRYFDNVRGKDGDKVANPEQGWSDDSVEYFYENVMLKAMGDWKPNGDVPYKAFRKAAQQAIDRAMLRANSDKARVIAAGWQYVKYIPDGNPGARLFTLSAEPEYCGTYEETLQRPGMGDHLLPKEAWFAEVDRTKHDYANAGETYADCIWRVGGIDNPLTNYNVVVLAAADDFPEPIRLPGYIRIVKKSASSFTNGNENYAHNMEGTKFEIATDSEIVETVTIDSEGIAVSDELLEGTYYVREIEAPDGYRITDDEWHSVEVMGGETVTFNAS